MNNEQNNRFGAQPAAASHQQGLQVAEGVAVYSPLTLNEVRDLSAMQAGAPWAENVVAGVAELFAIADDLRAKGKRPVDPADEHGHSHRWNDEGERCLKCGDKDWMADRFCSVSDAPMPERAPGAPVPRDVAPYPAGLPPELDATPSQSPAPLPEAQPVSDNGAATYFAGFDESLECAVIFDKRGDIKLIVPNGKLKVSTKGGECNDCKDRDLQFAKNVAVLVNASQAHGKSEAVAAFGSYPALNLPVTQDKRWTTGLAVEFAYAAIDADRAQRSAAAPVPKAPDAEKDAARGPTVLVTHRTDFELEATATVSEPAEHSIRAEREDVDANWYITVTGPDGLRSYDGWWQGSAGRSVEDVVQEALRGAALQAEAQKTGGAA